jgi:hypothetical protein
MNAVYLDDAGDPANKGCRIWYSVAAPGETFRFCPSAKSGEVVWMLLVRKL